MELYLSPDQRFLTESLFDTTTDPESEHRQVAEGVQKALLSSGASPIRGGHDAVVTIVVFSDFQCSFCKRLAAYWEALPLLEKNQTRLVFKHRPLAMHKWARPAALAAICASYQGSEPFWKLHDFLFSQQSSLTDETLSSSINDFMAQSPQFSVKQFQPCLNQRRAELDLQRDEVLADAYHVSAVPTIFINGVRKEGVSSPEGFQAAIRFAIVRSRRAEGTVR